MRLHRFFSTRSALFARSLGGNVNLSVLLNMEKTRRVNPLHILYRELCQAQP